MIIIFWILFSIVILSELSILIGLLFCKDSSVEKIYKNDEKNNRIKNPKFYLLVPMFDESKSAHKVYDYFSKLTSSDVQCVFITTEKETKIYNECKTRTALERLMIEKPAKNIQIYHYPLTTGNKVHQLNYFLKTHEAELNKDNVFIFDYDCDSRPDLDTIKDVKRILNNKPNANVIQQSSRFWPVNNKSELLKIEAMFQTRWAFGFERFNQYLSTFKYINRLSVPFAYCVGHGLCIRSSYLYKLGMFPTPLEDVPLGMMLTLMSEPIYPCVTKDTGEVVPSVKALIRQAGHWVRGPLQVFTVMKKANEMQNVSIYRNVMFFIRIILDVISWVQYLLLFIVSLILLAKTYKYLLLSVCAVGLLTILSLLVTAKYYSDSRWNVTFRSFAMSPVRHLVRGTSIFSLYYQSTFGWFYDKKKNS